MYFQGQRTKRLPLPEHVKMTATRAPDDKALTTTTLATPITLAQTIELHTTNL